MEWVRKWGLVLTCLCGLQLGLQAQDFRPWRGTRLQGSPEPPLPYATEIAFADLTWDHSNLAFFHAPNSVSLLAYNSLQLSLRNPVSNRTNSH